MADWLSLAAAAHATPVAVGWTPTTWVSLIFGGGTFGAICTLIVSIQKNNNAKAKQDGDLEDQRWNRLMMLNTTLTDRVTALEKSLADTVRQGAQELADERKRCDEEVAELRRHHAEEIADVRRELAGVYRTIGSQASASARMFEPRDDLPDDIKDRLRAMEQPGRGEVG